MTRRTSYSATEARRFWATIVRRVEVGGERITITRHGKITMVLLPMKDLEKLQFYEPGGAGAPPPSR